MAEYYRQRASAGLIISEATAVTPMGIDRDQSNGTRRQQRRCRMQEELMNFAGDLGTS
jgi:2,4-dienoyl-CoA reductase-like NADH-dependent reductase (Old Yellow Enzyme family)